MVGISASGKTTISNKLFPKHVHISLDKIPHSNRDIENTLIEENLLEKNNIVIDDTNLTKKIRSTHIDFAKKYNAEINVCFIDIPMWKVQLNNRTREKTLHESILFKMKKQLEEPHMDEGFDFIQVIPNNFKKNRLV